MKWLKKVGWARSKMRPGYLDDTGNTHKLYRLRDKTFSTEVSPDHGNFEFLMASDLDMGKPLVRGELMWWGR